MHHRLCAIAAAIAVGSFVTLAAVPGFAADAKSEAASSYAKERADCEAGRTSQDRATCLKEAGAAQAEKKRNRLDNTGSARQNAIERCNVQTGKDKTDCLARIEGPTASNQQTITSGSVTGGGVLRETRTTTVGAPVVVVPATPAMPASAPR